MKKNLFIAVLLTMLMSMVGTDAFARSFDIAVANSDGVTIYYYWANNNTELSVCCKNYYYERLEAAYVYESSYSGNVNIPAFVEYGGNTYVVTSISDHAFYNCKNLTSIKIPNSITSIGSSAFSGCGKLSSITIPSSVTSIGGEAFYGTAWYQNLPDGLIYAGKVAYKYKGDMPVNTSISIYEGTSGIAGSAFSGCSNLTSIEIPSSVTSIGLGAFSGCTGLTTMTIPNSVTSIDMRTFSGCTGLTTLTIPNSITNIDYDAFYNCTALTSIYISDLVAWCNIKFGGLNPFYCAHHLYLDSDEITNLVIPNGVVSINNYAFSGCNGLTSVTIPNSVTSIGSSAFSDCTELSTVTIQGSLESDNNDTPFNNCAKIKEMIFDCEKISNIANGITSLETLTFSESVKEIGNNAFQGCSGIKSITIPSSVNTIGDYAFSGCSLSSVTIPSSVTNFGKCVFQECTELLTVKSYMTEPNTIGSGFSENTYRNGTLYVPAGTKELYIRFDGWKEFLKIVEMAGEEQAYLTILNGDEEVAKLKVKQGEGYTWKIPSTDDHKLINLYLNDALVTNQMNLDGFYTTPAITTSSTLKMIYEDDAKKRGDVNRDGTVNVADHVELSKIIMEQE